MQICPVQRGAAVLSSGGASIPDRGTSELSAVPAGTYQPAGTIGVQMGHEAIAAHTPRPARKAAPRVPDAIRLGRADIDSNCLPQCYKPEMPWKRTDRALR